MSHVSIGPIEGLSAYRLSRAVNEIDFSRVNSRGQMRSGATTKAVLRALCDRYPNVWASVETDAKLAGISARQLQRELRLLEHFYRLIVRIGGNCGRGITAQCFILDRKILNIVTSKRLFDAWEKDDTSHRKRMTSQNRGGDTTAIKGDASDSKGDIPDSEAAKKGDTVSPEVISNALREQNEENTEPKAGVRARSRMSEHESAQNELDAEKFFTWMADAFPKVNLLSRERAAIKRQIRAAPSELILYRSAESILELINFESDWERSHAGDTLYTNLKSKMNAMHEDLARQQAQAESMARSRAEIVASAAAEPLVAEEEFDEATLPQD